MPDEYHPHLKPCPSCGIISTAGVRATDKLEDLQITNRSMRELLSHWGDGFVDLAARGLVSEETIDDFVDYWHRGSSPLSLHTYLGMSKEDYAEWVLQPDKLHLMVVVRKAQWETRQSDKHSARGRLIHNPYPKAMLMETGLLVTGQTLDHLNLGELIHSLQAHYHEFGFAEVAYDTMERVLASSQFSSKWKDTFKRHFAMWMDTSPETIIDLPDRRTLRFEDSELRKEIAGLPRDDLGPGGSLPKTYRCEKALRNECDMEGYCLRWSTNTVFTDTYSCPDCRGALVHMVEVL